MDHSYRETITGLAIMVDATGRRAAAEFVVEGEYLATDAGLPAARGQRYSLPRAPSSRWRRAGSAG